MSLSHHSHTSTLKALTLTLANKCTRNGRTQSYRNRKGSRARARARVKGIVAVTVIAILIEGLEYEKRTGVGITLHSNSNGSDPNSKVFHTRALAPRYSIG